MLGSSRISSWTSPFGKAAPRGCCPAPPGSTTEAHALQPRSVDSCSHAQQSAHDPRRSVRARGDTAHVTIERERVEVRSREEWRAWLQANHQTSPGAWLVTFKQGSGPYFPYGERVEEALCFGWVDSLARGLDEARSMQMFTPRKPTSYWSGANKERVARLTAAGLMAPAGQAMVDLAKATGTWNALDDVEAGVEPPDLAAALDASPDARRHWDAFPESVRRGLLGWVFTAKRQETRAKRIAEIVDRAAENVRANQPTPKPPDR
jgi:uncharacterized protein YdeI (YjbR/CyaY-like superfamily)